ncbi:MAG TPA: thiamine-phosphate kinase [Polyangiaceae bacterium]|nr:thiamine-phosphate kinase [Polyangiaceae bacterium]
MRRAGRSEAALIAQLTRVFSEKGAGARGVEVGIGDDAAVLAPIRAPLVWTVDACVEGVHFDARWLSPADVGARSFHAAASDLAAMGARPVAALSSLIVPAAFADRRLLELVRGQAEASRELACPVIGGNVSRGDELSVTTTVLGVAERPLLRRGARAGDEVWLLGDVGLAAAGLCCLERGLSARGGRADAVAVCVAAWRRPRALLREGRRLVGRAHAAIDVSDGLGADAGHIASESGVRLVVEEGRLARVLRPELVEVCRELELSPLELALSGGEDYAILATGPERARVRGAKVVGRVERGQGVAIERRDGSRWDGAAMGFDHFGGRSGARGKGRARGRA